MILREQQFAGATKASSSILSPLERRMARRVVPAIPGWLGTHHLTLLTLVWCALIVFFCSLAAGGDRRWLWGASAMIFCQYLTDFFDGKVGKYRNTGLVKWGFYMDHLLDYVFLCSVVAGYALILPASSRLYLFFVLAVFGGFMVNSFLALAATEKFSVHGLGLGPTEFRIALVALNTFLVFNGTRRMERVLPYVAAGGFVVLCALVYRTQKEIWRRDMAAKRNDECGMRNDERLAA